MTEKLSCHTITFVEWDNRGLSRPKQRAVASEVPVALEVNGFGFAVLMASGADIEDLACGFLLSDRVIDGSADIAAISCQPAEGGVLVRITLAPHLTERVGERVRPRLSDSSCGLCGIENIEQVMRPLPPLPQTSQAQPAAIFRARAALGHHQPLNAATGAVHAAALADAEGNLRLVREDVGRHNALDKLIGAMRRQGLDWDGGFVLMTSRCSYELVEKAALAGCPMLATFSAPTGLAIDRARAAGLRLAVLARDDTFLEIA